MKKIYFLLAMLMLSTGTIFAQEIVIPLIYEDPVDPTTENSRSLNLSPTASLDDCTLQINFPMYTTSQVVVRDAETGAVVYSASYDATRQVVVNLSSLPEGTYELHVYAFGKWWWGEFEIEDY